MSKNKNKKGYVVLMSVLVTGAIGLAVAVSLLWIGSGFSRTSFSFEQAVEARALANTCVEAALQQIWDIDYSGSGTLTLSNGNCTYLIVNNEESVRTITATGTAGEATRRVKAITNQLDPKITLSSWEEVGDF